VFFEYCFCEGNFDNGTNNGGHDILLYGTSGYLPETTWSSTSPFDMTTCSLQFGR
jgi:hypothetical protein